MSSVSGQENMRKKKFYKKKGYGKKKYYKKYSKLSFQRNMKIDAKLNLPLPQKYQTNLTCNCIGIIPAAGLPASGMRIYAVKGNDLHLPFSLTEWSTAAAFTLAKGAGTLTVGTLAPAGYANFMGTTVTGFYQYSRVLASAIKVCVTPNAIGDNCSICIAPIIPSASVLPNSIIAAASMPFATKIIQCSTGQSPKINSLKAYMTTKQIFGVNKEVILAENDYRAPVNADPTSVWEWYVFVQSNDSAASASAIDINCSIKYYVQFETSTGGGLRDTEN